MKNLARSLGYLSIVFAVALLAGCVASPAGPGGPYYSVSQPPAGGPGGGYLTVGPQDRLYVLRIDDRTPLGLSNLPDAMNALYQKGYDQVGREREADFVLDISFNSYTRDNPEQRAGQMVGGAVLGAATGAIIGGALGSPGRGAAIGAGSGAALGLVAPAGAAMVQVDIRTRSLRDGTVSSESATVDLAHVPPHDFQRVIDMQVSRMLQGLPSK
jgi:hypothetical protein